MILLLQLIVVYLQRYIAVDLALPRLLLQLECLNVHLELLALTPQVLHGLLKLLGVGLSLLQESIKPLQLC
jgi:hypothetical protein